MHRFQNVTPRRKLMEPQVQRTPSNFSIKCTILKVKTFRYFRVKTAWSYFRPSCISSIHSRSHIVTIVNSRLFNANCNVMVKTDREPTGDDVYKCFSAVIRPGWGRTRRSNLSRKKARLRRPTCSELEYSKNLATSASIVHTYRPKVSVLLIIYAFVGSAKPFTFR